MRVSKHPAPQRLGMTAQKLFCQSDLFHGRRLDLRLLCLISGLVQELVDDARTLLLLFPSFLRFLLLGEEQIVYFIAH